MREKIKKNKIFSRILLAIFVINLILLFPSITESVVDDKIVKSIVKISCVTNEGINYASGVIISNDGYILTNKHVVSDASGTVYTGCNIAITENKSSAPKLFYRGKSVIWASKDSGLDIALLKIETDKTDFSYTPLYTFGFPNLGVSVNALGYSTTGGDTITQTHGYVTDRIKDPNSFARYFIATDAKLTHGNSGGGAFTDYNEFLGITSANLANKFNTVGLIIPVLIIRDFLYINDYKFLIHEKDSGFYKYEENKPSSPDAGIWPIKIVNITDNSMDVCWPSLFVQGLATRYKADSFEFIIHYSTDGSNYIYKDTAKGTFKLLPVEKGNVGYYCYTSQNFSPATTYYFKLYARFYSNVYYYYNPFLDSDFSNPISATTNNTTIKCPENSTLKGNECHCVEGYEWNFSQTACIQTGPGEDLTTPKTASQSVIEAPKEEQKQPKEEIKQQQEENQQEEQKVKNQQESIKAVERQQSEQSEQLTEEPKSKRTPLIFLANILNTVKDFFVKLFGLFK